ncbi:hypothetical protein DFP72DRAFT_1176610, partial [Ephemerocybe angulata]
MDVIPAVYAWLSSLDSHTQQSIQFKQILRFMTLAARIRDDILLPQDSQHPSDQPPEHLPFSIHLFLADATGIPSNPLSIIDGLWKAVRGAVWNGSMAIATDPSSHQAALFTEHGTKYGIGYRSLYPPRRMCDNIGCTRTAAGRALHKAEQRQVLLFTMEGTVPAWSIHLYCQTCKINYHHNFSVHAGCRTYYQGIPSILQVGEHQFAEVKVINSWITLMVVGWVSATNCARFYNTAIAAHHGKRLSEEMGGWKFKDEVGYEHVYDGFTILSLLEYAEGNNTALSARHTGEEFGRFDDAVRLLVQRRRFSHPEVYHECDVCTRIFKGKKYRVVVTDGVTVGRPCCNTHNCKTALESPKNRFCKDCKELYGDKCRIKGCQEKQVKERKTCAEEKHQAVEDLYNERGKARFQLQQLLLRAWVTHPESSEPVISSDTPTGDRSKPPEPVPAIDELEEVEVVTSVARETFYGAEGVGSVIELLKRVYFIKGTMPEHIFYDTNCILAKAVADDPAFEGVKLTVDVFHFRSKHKETDEFCQKNCNPAAHEELLGEGSKAWFFNSSIAEQTNVWFGGYHSICREMSQLRYDFFLDEMIRRRNAQTLERLRAKGSNPRNVYRA